jgi:protein involved in polysaccharide export with SLBB domain
MKLVKGQRNLRIRTWRWSSVIASIMLLVAQGVAAQILPEDPFFTGVRPATETARPTVAAPQSAPSVQKPPSDVVSTLPPDPATSAHPLVFGSQLFVGRFGDVQFSGFNPDYQVTVGDRVSLRLWGAFVLDAVQMVDSQGNLFIPNVGPVNVLGVRNADLNKHVEEQVKRVYRSNVSVYITLEAAQPVKVYVTGFVRAPGLYGGLSSNSILYYLDKAGGIDPDRGSFIDVTVLRGGKDRARIDLYAFMLEGQMQGLQLQDGDTIVVGPRKHSFVVRGEVLNPYQFEFSDDRMLATRLLALAKPKPSATHMSIVRKVGVERRSEYHALSEAGNVEISDGDEVTITADKYPGTILVRVEGAHLGQHTLVLPYGSRLKDAVAQIKPAPQARPEATQLYRKSVAQRQKEMLEASLRNLESHVLTARSSTNEEATLRSKEAELVLQFVERARKIQPKGQIVIGAGQQAGETLLEDGDIIRVPEISSLVMVHGEVLFPNAVVYDFGASVQTYVKMAGGFTQNADDSRFVVLHQDGSFSEGEEIDVKPGDEVMVLPKVETKSVEIARGITQILYQIAVAAKIVFGL